MSISIHKKLVLMTVLTVFVLMVSACNLKEEMYNMTRYSMPVARLPILLVIAACALFLVAISCGAELPVGQDESKATVSPLSPPEGISAEAGCAGLTPVTVFDMSYRTVDVDSKVRFSGNNYHSISTVTTGETVEHIRVGKVEYFRVDTGSWHVSHRQEPSPASVGILCPDTSPLIGTNIVTDDGLTVTEFIVTRTKDFGIIGWLGFEDDPNYAWKIWVDMSGRVVGVHLAAPRLVGQSDQESITWRFSGFGEPNPITAPDVPIPTPTPTRLPIDIPHQASFQPVNLGRAVVADATNGTLQPVSFTLNGISGALTKIAWEDGKATIEFQPSVALTEYHAIFIAPDGTLALRLDFDAAKEAKNGTKRTFEWGVCKQPWVHGDLLVLQIRKNGETLTGTNDTLPCSTITPKPTPTRTPTPMPVSTVKLGAATYDAPEGAITTR